MFSTAFLNLSLTAIWYVCFYYLFQPMKMCIKSELYYNFVFTFHFLFLNNLCLLFPFFQLFLFMWTFTCWTDGVESINYLSEEMLISLCIPLFLGMLPLLGSSTSDPEEELEELRMKLQIMKGEWKNAVKLTLMVKLNRECF